MVMFGDGSTPTVSVSATRAIVSSPSADSRSKTPCDASARALRTSGAAVTELIFGCVRSGTRSLERCLGSGQTLLLGKQAVVGGARRGRRRPGVAWMKFAPAASFSAVAASTRRPRLGSKNQILKRDLTNGRKLIMM